MTDDLKQGVSQMLNGIAPDGISVYWHIGRSEGPKSDHSSDVVFNFVRAILATAKELTAREEKIAQENEQLKSGVFGFNAMAKNFQEREAKFLEILKTARSGYKLFIDRYPCPDIDHDNYRAKVCSTSEEAVKDIDKVFLELGIKI